MSFFPKNSKVIELTPLDFTGIKINHNSLKGKKGIIMVYMPNCHWCKVAKPEYSKTADTLGMSFPMYALNGVKYPEITEKLKINSYPTIKYVNQLCVLTKEFSSERTSLGFLEDICKEAKVCKR